MRRKENVGGVGARGSVKRQSEIQRDKKKSRQEEREEDRARKASYYRKVTGADIRNFHRICLPCRLEKSQGADDGLLLWRLLEVFQSLPVLRC